MICAPQAIRFSGVRDLTVASVPTGMNIGVWMDPCMVSMIPERAFVSVDLAVMVNCSMIEVCFLLLSNNKHGVTITEKSITVFNGFLISGQNG